MSAAEEIAELESDIRMLQARQEADPSSLSEEIAEAIAWRQERIEDLRKATAPSTSAPPAGAGEYGTGPPASAPPPAPAAAASPSAPAPARRAAPASPSAPAPSRRAAPASGGGGRPSGGGTKRLTQEQIREMFDYYANFGRSSVMGFQDTIDSFMFMKFAKECPGLLGRDLTRTDVDLIFTKAKPKLERRLKFEHFLDALAAISEKKYPAAEPANALRSLIANHLGPQYDKVQAEILKTGETEVPLSGVFERLYDVRNYTGVYAERFRSGDGRINADADNRVGRRYEGNTNTGTDEVIHDISVLMRPNLHRGGSTMSRRGKGKDGSDQGGRGVDGRGRTLTPGKAKPKTLAEAGLGSPGGLGSTVGRPSTVGGRRSVGSGERPSSAPRAPPATASPAPAARAEPTKEELMEAMEEAKAGRPEKLMSLTMSMAGAAGAGTEEPGASGGAGGAASGDSGAAGGGGDLNADEAAEVNELSMDIKILEERLDSLSPDAPEVSELQEAVRWRKERIAELQEQASARKPRAPAASTPGRPPTTPARTSTRASGTPGSSRRPTSAAGGRRSTGKAPVTPSHPIPATLNQEQIHEVFEYYANFGRTSVQNYQDTIDSFMFMKFARECPGLLGRGLTRTDVDLIFTKAKPKFERRLKFEHFLDALAAISEKKFSSLGPADGLRKLIREHLAPLYAVVQDELLKTGETEVPLSGVFERLYDVRNYTGVYAERFRSGDGRINADADNRVGRAYAGNTNTGTDEVIHDISVLMRPNLHRGGSTMSRRGKGKDGSDQGARGVDGRGRSAAVGSTGRVSKGRA